MIDTYIKKIDESFIALNNKYCYNFINLNDGTVFDFKMFLNPKNEYKALVENELVRLYYDYLGSFYICEEELSNALHQIYTDLNKYLSD